MIITFTQLKGGVGKSTGAINLGVAFAEKGAKVGFLDTDTQNTLWEWFKRRERVGGDCSNMECLFLQGHLKDSLHALRKRNDIVIVDTAGFANPSFGPAIVNSQVAICPFAPKQYDLEVAPLVPSHQSFESALMLNPSLKVRALLNSCPTNAKDKRADEAEEYLRSQGYTVYTSRLTRRESYNDAGQIGRGVTEIGDDKAAQEITHLMEEITHDR